MLSSYEVPIIPNDLRREETMVHIIGALNQLTKISTDIFAKIGSKCDEFQGKIAGINQRVDTANAKLEVLKATKKATVVFSSARQARLLLKNLSQVSWSRERRRLFRHFHSFGKWTFLLPASTHYHGEGSGVWTQHPSVQAAVHQC